MARIRTIKPEFWDTPRIDTISPWARLTFIALLNWADDYGTGTCNPRELFGFVFPHDKHLTLEEFRRALDETRRVFEVTFYSLDGRRYYNILTFSKHQKVDRRSQPKHPGPYTPGVIFDTPEDEEKARKHAEFHGIHDFPRNPAEPSAENIEPSEGPAEPSTLEIGNRNLGNRNLNTPPSPSLDADAPTESEEVANENQPTPKPKPKPKPRTYPDDFETFWDAYPRRTAKADAYKAWKAATKRATPETITQAAARYAQDPNLPDPQYIPYPATWLRSDSWDNPPEPQRGDLTPTQRRLQATLTHGLTWAAQDPHDHALEATREDPPWQITA